MNIYLVTRKDKTDWDEYYGCVTVCETEEEARNIHPDEKETKSVSQIIAEKNEEKRIQGKNHWVSYDWVDNMDKIVVTKLGVAGQGIRKGVKIASFKQG